jgi:hypothetical protein
VPLKKLRPAILPPSTACAPEERSLLNDKLPDTLQYLPPKSIADKPALKAATGAFHNYDDYYEAVKPNVLEMFPPALHDDRAMNAFIEYFLAVSGESQLEAYAAAHPARDIAEIDIQRRQIARHSGPGEISHAAMKEFTGTIFQLQLRPPAAALVSHSSTIDRAVLSPAQIKALDANPAPDQAFLEYFEAYYKGKFVDRMGNSISKPTISLTITDSDITAAETMLLEFLFDALDLTPVMGDGDTAESSNTFYPAGSSSKPTAISVKDPITTYRKIPAGDASSCGVTAQNSWVLRDLAQGASDQAAAVGGLIANTPGGVSIGLGIFGKISIGDNQTLSVLVKTAASRFAMRATLAASYQVLKNIRFNVPDPAN